MKKKNMKKIKPVETKLIKYTNEDTDQVKKFIFILIGVALISVLLYFITAKYLVKDGFKNDTASDPEVSIIYNAINVGNVFNRPYEKYYVLAYDPTTTKASYYSSLLNRFEEKDSKIYYVDLSLDVNKAYLGEKGNAKATKPSELSLKDPTLIVIEKGKIKNYYEDEESIAKVIG